MKTVLYSVFISFLVFSCNKGDNVSDILEKVNLPKPRQYSLLEGRSDWAVGEGTESYVLKISNTDYKEIVNEIKGKNFFKHLNNSKQPTYAFDSETDTKKINEAACWYDNKFFYQIFSPNPGFTVTIVLERDSLMYVKYDDL